MEQREPEIKAGSRVEPDSELGHMTEALIPVSGSPLIWGEVLMAGDLWRCGVQGVAENQGMDKSKLRLILRVSLLALFALLVLSIGLAIISDKLLPDELAEWHRRNNATDFGVSDILGLLFWGAGVVLLLISIIGLFFYQRWSAWMFLGVNLVFSLQVLFSPTVEPGLLSYVGGWSDVLTGLILGLAFFTEALAADATIG